MEASKLTFNDHKLKQLFSSYLSFFFVFSFNNNYSIYGIMDLLHNTLTMRFSKNIKHHKTLYTLKSVREFINDKEQAKQMETLNHE